MEINSAKSADEIKDMFQEAFSHMYPSDPMLVNYSEAAKIFANLSAQGYGYASNRLGVLYCLGRGVEKNVNKGRELLRLGEKQGSVRMVYGLMEAGVLETDDYQELIDALAEDGDTKRAMLYSMGYRPLSNTKES